MPRQSRRRIREMEQEGGRETLRSRRRQGGRQPENVEDLSRQELYRKARQQGVEGRSKMTKRELIKALRTS